MRYLCEVGVFIVLLIRMQYTWYEEDLTRYILLLIVMGLKKNLLVFPSEPIH